MFSVNHFFYTSAQTGQGQTPPFVLGERTEIHVTDQVQPVTDDKPSELPHDYLTNVWALCKTHSLKPFDFLITQPSFSQFESLKNPKSFKFNWLLFCSKECISCQRLEFEQKRWGPVILYFALRIFEFILSAHHRDNTSCCLYGVMTL